MRTLNRSTVPGLVSLFMLPLAVHAAPNTGGGPATHDCAGVQKTCGAWGAKGNNTCRSCQQAQCKTENGKDVLAGNKTTSECYEGHGSPPADKGMTRRPLQRAPILNMNKVAVMGRGIEGEQPKAPEESPATKP